MDQSAMHIEFKPSSDLITLKLELLDGAMAETSRLQY